MSSIEIYEKFLRKKAENEAKMAAFYLSKYGNVLGGPLDGSYIPDGTSEGLTYQWDNNIKRWIFKTSL